MSEQPEALRLANRMALIGESMDGDADRAAAELRRLHALCEESRTVVRGLLNALPSATTHPAISAARKIIYKLEDEQ